jgi:predicted ribosomally synthesized peptide with nif11-like leader
MSRESLEQFIQIVLETPALQEQLQVAPNRASLVRRAVELGEENGYSFTAEEVQEKIEEYAQQQELQQELPQELRFPLQNIADVSFY